ncbi:Slp family lipoprotein [Petrachloros mirabilis]
MSSRLVLTGLAFLLTMTDCASTQDAGNGSAAIQIAFPQVKAAPDSFKGQSVMFGGEVLSARRLKEGTRIEILQLPLDQSGSPAYDLRQSQGRFMALHRDFLDPATLPSGSRVTLTGEVTGSITLPLDETEYNYPIIDVKHLQVWTSAQDAAPYLRPYMGPGFYWGPYWSPYWRPWPYYW